MELIFAPLEVEYDPPVEDHSPPLWKLNIRHLKRLATSELASLYGKPYASNQYKQMIKLVLANRKSASLLQNQM